VKLTSLLPPAAAVVLMTAAVLASTSGVQATQDQPPAPQTSPAPADQAAPATPPAGTAMQAMRPMRSYPAPTNLQVLPKDLTGAQVHEIMETIDGSLGVHCDFCHAADPKNLMPNGRPRMDFADDSKDDKKIARIMFTMTDRINADYINKAKTLDPDSMGMTVKCGTCHRGHEMPEDFVIPTQQGPGGPPPAGGPPAGAPPAAPPPPAN
jgi:Photosynthetic reaction centre cytochrome C subunit